MRLVIVVALATLALAGAAVGGSGFCAPSCDVYAHLLGFAPPVTEVDRGSTVTWRTLDGPHTATGASSAFDPPCFDTELRGSSRGEAYFTIMEGRLYAVSELDAGELVACEDAVALPDGSFRLDYICAYHNYMTGALLVR